ncbi:MAG: peptidase [Hyphomicrobiales bacterium]|nr:peptidase [Hyphomicrobiales bacterium]
MLTKKIMSADEYACGPNLTKRAPPMAVAGDGMFEGYASLFGIVDLGGDEVMPGAFRTSLARRDAKHVRMLWQHDPASPIGKWLSMTEDARGLKVKGQLNLAVARAREALALMRDGAVDGLSIGFRVKRASKSRGGSTRKLMELDLWEVSIVTFPMLPQARVSAVKRERAPQRVANLQPPVGDVATLMRRAAALMK